jgi:hypothetical protein
MVDWWFARRHALGLLVLPSLASCGNLSGNLEPGGVEVAGGDTGVPDLGSDHAEAGGPDTAYGDGSLGGNSSSSGSLGFDGSSQGNPVSPDQACSDLASSNCNWLDRCDLFSLQEFYGDLATCIAQAKLLCVLEADADGSGIGSSSATRESCALAVASRACDSTAPLPVCESPGALPSGASCASNDQCAAGTQCKSVAGQICGVCTSLAPVGGDCLIDSDCQSGLACAMPTGAPAGTCVVARDAGSPCNAQQPCTFPLVCTSGVCASRLGVGSPCIGSPDDCDIAKALSCNVYTHVCVPLKLSSDGGRCGIQSDGADAFCSGNGFCTSANVCLAAVPPGGACDFTNGPYCQFPAACINDICMLPDPSLCQ